MSSLVHILDQAGYLPAPQGKVIEEICRHSGVPFVGSILELGIVDEDDLYILFKKNSTYAAWDHLAEFDRAAQKLAFDSMQTFLPVMEEFEVYPLALDNGVLIMACTDPSDREMIQQLEFFMNCRIKPILAKKSQIHAALRTVKSDFFPRQNKFPLEKLLPHVANVRQLKHLVHDGYDVPTLDEKIKIVLNRKKAKEDEIQSAAQAANTANNENQENFVSISEVPDLKEVLDEKLVEESTFEAEGHLAELAKEMTDEYEVSEESSVSQEIPEDAPPKVFVATRHHKQPPRIKWSADPVTVAVQKARLATYIAPHNTKSVQESTKGFALAGLIQGLVAIKLPNDPSFQALAHWRRADDKSMFYCDEGIQHYVNEDVNKYLVELEYEGCETIDLDAKDPPDCLRRFSVWANSEQSLYVYRQLSDDADERDLVLLAVADRSLIENAGLQNEISELMKALVNTFGAPSKPPETEA